ARWTLVWTQHHLLLDRWSWPLVLREVGVAYDALRRAPASPASAGAGAGVTSLKLPAPASFRDYVAWRAARPNDAAEQYWREELDALGTPLRLLDGVAPNASAAPRAEHSAELSAVE